MRQFKISNILLVDPECLNTFPDSFLLKILKIDIVFYILISLRLITQNTVTYNTATHNTNMKNYILILFSIILTSCISPQKKYIIGVSQCSEDEWRNKMNSEISLEALFYDNIEVEIISAGDDNEKQINDINYFIEKNVDLLVVAPNEANSITPVVERAYDAGIPVIIVDRKINSDKFTSFIGSDNYEIGSSVGKYITNLYSGRKINLVELTGLQGSTPAFERSNGFNDIISENLNINIIARLDAEWLSEKAEHHMDSLLNEHTEIDLVFSHNDPMASGAYKSALKYSLQNKIRFIGIDALPVKNMGIDMVNSGMLQATFIYATGGDKVIQTAVNILQKKDFEREIILSTAVVDSTNANVIKLQSDQISELDNKIDWLNSRMDHYLSRYSIQKWLLYACLLIMILFASMLAAILRAFWIKIRMNHELSERNEEITKQKEQLEIQRDQLIELSEQLEKATHEKLLFFTNVSHDLRTPLTLISAPLVNLLQDNSMSDDNKILLQMMNKNVNILLRLISEVMDFRKYENGKMKFNPGITNLSGCIDEWYESFKPVAYNKHIKFILEKEDNDYTAYVDKDKLERICFNLLSNAFKFTPENGKVIFQCCTVVENNNKYIRFTVKDTGQGISKEHIERIFERFYQTDIHHSGSGIGLALVKAFTDMHNGKISVCENETKGTSITVYISVSEHLISINESVKEPDEVLVSSKRMQLENSFTVSETEIKETTISEAKDSVLIIDDNEDVCSYLSSVLKADYNIYIANNGNDGILLAIKYIPNIIICDIMMPGIDGLECCRRLKAEMPTSHIPVIMLTACSMDEHKINGFQSGADSYISKPFNPVLLKTRICNLLENRRRIDMFFKDNKSFGYTAISSGNEDIEVNFIDSVKKIIENNLSDSEFSVEDIGAEIGLSRVQLYRKVKALTNYTPVELLRNARLNKGARLLTTTDKTISEITYEVGFTSPSYFTKCYKDFFGENPTQFLKRKR